MKRFLIALTLIILASAIVPAAHAQSDGVNSDDATPALPEGSALTQEAVRNVLSELSDEQVRKVLLDRLTKEAEEEQAALAANSQTTLGQTITQILSAYGAMNVAVVRAVPKIPSEIADTVRTFVTERGDAGFWRFLLALALSVAAGVAAANVIWRLVHRSSTEPPETELSLFTRLRKLGVRFFAQVLGVLGFSVAAYAVNASVTGDNVADETTIAFIIGAAVSTLFVRVAARFVLSPKRPELRLVTISDSDAGWLMGRIVLLAALFNFGIGFSMWMEAFGTPRGDSWFAFWINLVFHVLLIATLWQGRHILAEMLLDQADLSETPKRTSAASPEPAPAEPDGDIVMVSLGESDDDDGDGDGDEDGAGRVVRLPQEGTAASEAPEVYRTIAFLWPKIAIGLVIAHYLLITMVAANLPDTRGLGTAMAITLVILLTLPFIDHAIQAIVDTILPSGDDQPPAIRAANSASRGSIRRITRVAGLAVLFVFLLAIWGVDFVDLAAQGVGARFANGIVSVLLIAAIAYVAWEAVGIAIDRAIAHEQAEKGIDPTATAGGHSEGEGGGAGARLGTLLPLVKGTAKTAIAVLAGLVILGEFGVNVVPLLAGFGVVGLAIGFGAQTLVKDIVSGVFFLIDDAFRKGEYIDLGSVKGTVEKISIRSMQLRHHRGVLNTVPFGEIRNVANMSRDWVVMKFPLRVPYDTDPEKVRKLIKKLGVQLLDHPEFGSHFLEPLKCQGVAMMEDSAMIMPVKYMSRPGDQWALRRLVLTEIQKLFDEHGIKFANREVTVRMAEGSDGTQTPAEVASAAGSAARRLLDEEQQRASRA